MSMPWGKKATTLATVRWEALSRSQKVGRPREGRNNAEKSRAKGGSDWAEPVERRDELWSRQRGTTIIKPVGEERQGNRNKLPKKKQKGGGVGKWQGLNRE